MKTLLITNNKYIEDVVRGFYKEKYKHIKVDCFNQNVHIHDLKESYSIIIIDLDSLDFSGVIVVDLLMKRFNESVIAYISKHQYNHSLYPITPFYQMLLDHLYLDLFRLMYLYYGMNGEVLRFKKYSRSQNRAESFYHYLMMNDVVYIESKESESIIHKLDKSISIYMPISKIDRQLEESKKDNFIRIHRFYIVNVKYIKDYRNYNVYLKDSSILPVGRKYREILKKILFLTTNNE